MSGSVLVLVSDRWEASLVTVLERDTGYRVARRCADLADLLAAAASGAGDAALVSAGVRSLDRGALASLTRSGLHVVGVYPPGDETAERQLRQLGLSSVLAADASGVDLEAALERCAQSGHRLLELPPVDGSPTGSALTDNALTGSAPSFAPTGTCDVGEAGTEDPAGPGRPGQVIAVWGPTGAPGRTTVAVNLASELALLGCSTVLVDADTYGGCVSQALSLLDEAPGLAAATRAADHGSLDLRALAAVAPEVRPGMRVLTGLPKAERWPELRPASLELVLGLARHLARFTVVDCGFSLEDDEDLSYDTTAPRRNAATLATLGVADRVLAVGAADPVGLQRLVRALQELGTTPSPRPRVVVNKVRASAVGRSPEQAIREALARFAGIEDPWFVPDDRPALDAAMLAGRVLCEIAPQSPARRAVVALAADLAGVGLPTRRRRRRA